MNVVKDEDFDRAVNAVVENLVGVDGLYPSQLEVLRALVVGEDNVFLTAPTNSGKTLAPVILPGVLKELNKMNYNYPPVPRVLFITALNSLQLSLQSSMESLGLQCAAVTKENVDQILRSEVSILFIGPEILKIPSVTKSLLKLSSSFVLKVVDEVHIGGFLFGSNLYYISYTHYDMAMKVKQA